MVKNILLICVLGLGIAPVIPGGHLKFPHLWPGQNPPGDRASI